MMTRASFMPVAMLLCVALSANFVLVAGHDSQRILEIGALLSCGFWILAARLDIVVSLFNGAAGKLLAFFFLLGLMSSVQARDPQVAAFEVSVFFLVYVAALAAAAEIGKRGVPALIRLLQIIAVAGALYCVKFFVAYFGSFTLGIPLAVDDFTPGFSNIRFFNHVQTSTLPLLILLCSLTPRPSRLRWLWLAVTAYWWLALFATTGRGTLVGIVAACVAAMALIGKSAWPYLRQVVYTATLGLVAYVALLVIVPALLGAQGIGAFAFAINRTVADPASGRMILWKRAAELIMQHPFFGIGPMHFAHEGRALHLGAHPHDWILQIASEWGVPALVCLTAAIGIALFALVGAARQINANDGDNRAVGASLLVAAVALLVDAAVSGTIVMPQSQLGIALFLACAIGWYRTRLTMPVARPAVAARVGCAVLVLVAMIGLANALPDGFTRVNGGELSAALQAVNAGDARPRLWKAGYF